MDVDLFINLSVIIVHQDFFRQHLDAEFLLVV